ncbi:hypothetical protein PtrSN002B_005763 [Pyrenophora tritici-repentis]|uniref:Uncharacterized protein n=1 Tax=Pyrenophora tritici-repentis TaxID=45151 RepID=A0A2W1E8Q5_9PLEO|nr:hypothetical protein PtrV1_00204 [Pyrenophora tritici-repentis]KAF7452924.1 hypothetical protein A1F99_001820 [Pyrenophora tritici-repentis]KAF7575968.1 hypothetical protein PtrM4_002080 [Pyrenophora tritici-repentis]KAG9377657.1 hypothetical protein A1F94_012060 [Pyrenophora tritici-repentis]KAI0573200.1 hypothetical protein Alg130_10191 [Pyrenophora tritici-repentis]
MWCLPVFTSRPIYYLINRYNTFSTLEPKQIAQETFYPSEKQKVELEKKPAIVPQAGYLHSQTALESSCMSRLRKPFSLLHCGFGMMSTASTFPRYRDALWRLLTTDKGLDADFGAKSFP